MSKNVTTYMRLMRRWTDIRKKQDQASKPRWRIYWKYEIQNRLAACDASWKSMTPAEQKEFLQVVKIRWF